MTPLDELSHSSFKMVAFPHLPFAPSFTILLLSLFFQLSFSSVHSLRHSRSPDSDRIQQWKLSFSDDLAPSGIPSRLLPKFAVSCQWALYDLCLRHVSCRELWSLFRRNCMVDAQNQCRMTNKEDCWQSYEGISWTGLGWCTCPGNNSDCHWIRLQTNYNKCIYELGQDPQWHTKLAMAAQFSSRALQQKPRNNNELGRKMMESGVEEWKKEESTNYWKNKEEEDEDEKRLKMEEERKRRMEEEGKKREEERKRKEEDEKRRRMEEEERMRRIEEEGKKREEERKRKEEDKKRRRMEEEERMRRIEDERKRKTAEEETRRVMEEEEQQQKRKVTEEKRRREDERKIKEVEGEMRRKMKEEERKRKEVEEERRRKLEEEERMRKEVEEERRREDERKNEAEEEKRMKLEEEERMRKEVEEEGRMKLGEEERKRKETEEVKRRMEDEHKRRKTMEEWKMEEERMRRKQLEEERRREEERKRKEMEEERKTEEERDKKRKAEEIEFTSNSQMGEATSTKMISMARTVNGVENRTTGAGRQGGRTQEEESSTTVAPLKVEATTEAGGKLVTQAERPPTTTTTANWASSGRRTTPNRTEEEEERGAESLDTNPNSTCPAVLALCEQDEPCRWHLSELRIRCARGRGCRGDHRRQCRPALARFVRFVHGSLAEAVLFCECEPDDDRCWKTMPIRDGGECKDSGEISQPPVKPSWTCTQTVQMCRTEAECNRHLSALRSACPLSSFSSSSTFLPSSNSSTTSFCSASSLAACRSALAVVRGSWLDEPCHCASGDTSCAELAEGMWPRHPCIDVTRKDFNEQLRNGQIMLVNTKKELNTKTGDKRVLIRVGQMGTEGTMELGEEVKLEPEVMEQRRKMKSGGGGRGRNSGKKKSVEEAEKGEKQKVHIERKMMKGKEEEGEGEDEKNARKEVYEWAEDEEARKMDEEREGDKKEQENGEEERKKKKKMEGEEAKWKKEDEDEKEDRKKEEEKKNIPHRRPMNRTTTNSAEESFATQRLQSKGRLRSKNYPDSEAGDGCRTRNVEGEWVDHQRDSVFRQYHDWSGRCSSWCECAAGNQSVQCHQLGCMPDEPCKTKHTTIGFGQRLYLEDRGACQCHGGPFICDTSELMPELAPGLYLTLGYSKPELELIREKVPKAMLERSGLISQSRSLAKDLATRLQFALERILPEDINCRLTLLEHFAPEAVVLLQLQWFGVEPMIGGGKGAKNITRTKQAWHTGRWEKICSGYARELEENFLLERATRYQLLLSTIKQIRVLDLLDGLPPDSPLPSSSSSPTSSSTSSSSSSSVHFPLFFHALFLLLPPFLLFPHY